MIGIDGPPPSIDAGSTCWWRVAGKKEDKWKGEGIGEQVELPANYIYI